MGYQSYKPPQLSNQKDKFGRRMIAYECKLCSTKINQPTSDSSCSNLNKHASICLRKHNQSRTSKSLASLGITGTGEIDPKEVPQLCAIWCAEAARPFSALVNASHKAILHPMVVKHLPNPQVVSKDIHLLYSAIQHEYRAALNAHNGALYLGINTWHSPNGYDILGIVMYQLAEDQTGDIKLESLPLDFVCLLKSHTGVYLANTVCLVVEKFGIQNKICGIVSNNAKNNEVMVREIKKLKWPRFQGEPHWIQCFAHILNLIVQAILRPFGSKNHANDNHGPTGAEEHSDGSDSDDGNAEEQIRVVPRGEKAPSEDEYSSNSNNSCSQRDVDDESLDEADIENASEEEDANTYTTNSCRLTLAKKLRYSPNSKAEFIKICAEKECETPHNIERDVSTQWNSTCAQLNSIIRCQAAVFEWQRHKRHGVDRKHQLNKSDLELARDLATCTLTKSPTTYPPLLATLNTRQHRGMPAEVNLLTYLVSVLHPLFKDEYFKLENWDPSWTAEAIRLAREMWVSHYKPQPITPASSARTASSKPKTGMLAGLGNAAAARGGDLSSNPLDEWLCGGLVLNGDKPVDPLQWWIQQKRSGNTHGAGCSILPSFGRDYVLAKRHQLAPQSLSRGMTVAFYSKNNKIKPGTLADWKQALKNDNRTNLKAKRKVIALDEEE
ncbi:hypothetical protein PTTG_27958 [Puccinia triticina 1-1 BBBD Race 1]|uniref:DUF659 domain-containing protein n=1 Tax=Puccinia triticina (isolate 1-1 / race 1 (BBBD)) TaxID=630390 RepID=A0A180GG92_PUCT1|nr:hypothetical protein PTTG_27958 [Puccinia triticina 1-1 BBBD Race 1]